MEFRFNLMEAFENGGFFLLYLFLLFPGGGEFFPNLFQILSFLSQILLNLLRPSGPKRGWPGGKAPPQQDPSDQKKCPMLHEAPTPDTSGTSSRLQNSQKTQAPFPRGSPGRFFQGDRRGWGPPPTILSSRAGCREKRLFRAGHR